MRSSLPQGNLQDEAENSDRESTPTEAGARPPLVRSAPERLSDISQSLTERRNSQSTRGVRKVNNDADKSKQSPTSAEGGAQRTQSKIQASRADEERLAKLREAMNAKLLLQQRTRRSSPKSDSGSPRVAAIQEAAGGASPQSINAMIARTTSNESTESAKTIRASTPASAPLRTPSYPFPYVPGTPKTRSSPFHQPFTSLSPTASAGPTSDENVQGTTSYMQSGESTPAATARAFMPPGTFFEGQEDSRFPTPNLYEMVLQLNAEPGLEQWWTTVTNLMHDHFRADRATLVLPRDSSEIENVSQFIEHTARIMHECSVAALRHPLVLAAPNVRA